jgi:hypothetical protein
VIKFELLPSSLKAQVFFFKAEKKKGLWILACKFKAFFNSKLQIFFNTGEEYFKESLLL